jgi:hypothetical protein
MPRISPLHPDDAPVEARTVLEDFFKTRNSVPNMFRTLARRPAAMKKPSRRAGPAPRTNPPPHRLKPPRA